MTLVLPFASPGISHEGSVINNSSKIIDKDQQNRKFTLFYSHLPLPANPATHPTQKQQSQMQEMLRQLSQQQQQRVQSNTETVHTVMSRSARSPPEEGDMSKQTATSG